MDGPLLYLTFIIGSVLVLASIVWFAVDLQKAKKLLRKADEEKNELQSIISDAEMMVDELNNFSDYLLAKIEQKNNEAGVFIEKLDETLNSFRHGQIVEEPARKNLPVLSKKKYTGKRRSAPTYGDDAGMAASPNLSLRPPSRNLTDDLDAAPVETGMAASPVLSLRPPSRNLTDDRSVEPEIIETAVDNIENIVQYEEQSGRIHAGRRYKSRKIIRGNRRDERSNIMAPRNKKNLEVLRYHEEGLEEAAIAKKMNIGRGEVALILGLYENGAAQLNHRNG